MDGPAARAARERIDLADRRLVALQEAGIDTSGLVARLRFARDALAAGQAGEAEAAGEEILATIRRLADGGEADDRRRRSSGRLRAIAEPGLTQEVVAKAITVGELERRVSESAARVAELHAKAMEDRVAAAVTAVTEATADLVRFRTELDGTVRALVAEHAGAPGGGQAEEAARLAAEAVQRADAAAEQARSALAGIAAFGEDMARYHGQLDGALQSWFADADQRNAAAQAQAEAAERRAAEADARAAANAEALSRAVAELGGLRTTIEGNLRAPAEASRRAEQASHQAAELAEKADARAQAAEASAAANAAAFTELRSTLESSLRTLVDEAAERTLAVLAEARSQESAVRHASGSTELNELIAATGEQAAAAAAQAAEAAEAARAATAAATEAAARAATRDDLQQLGDALRKDLDWQVEKVAAERGWCTMADVEAALTRSGAAQHAGDAGQAATSRLERALAGFISQTQQQQQRFMDLLQQRIQGGEAPGSGALSRSPAAGTAPRPRKRETEQLMPVDEAHLAASDAELDVLSRSSQYRALKDDRVAQPGADAPGPAAAAEAAASDELPTRRLPDQAAPELAPTTRAVNRQPAAPPAAADDASSDLRPATVRVSAQQVAAADPDQLVAAVAAEIAAKGGTSKIVRSGELPVVPPTAAGAGTGRQPAQDGSSRTAAPSEGAGDISALLARAEAALSERADQVGSDMRATRAAEPPPAAAPPDDTALGERLLRLLPAALAAAEVRNRILALVATEALQPGALGELSGIRAFIRNEVRQAASEVAAELRREAERERLPT